MNHTWERRGFFARWTSFCLRYALLPGIDIDSMEVASPDGVGLVPGWKGSAETPTRIFFCFVIPVPLPLPVPVPVPGTCYRGRRCASKLPSNIARRDLIH